MFSKSFKWFIAVLISSFIIMKRSQHEQITLGSLSGHPSDIYTPDYYANGTYLELPFGTMRYWLFGNERGNQVVLIHGLSTGSAVYVKLAKDLADNGHHVLVYDLYGRGYSDAPPVNYNEALYSSQLAMLLQKVGWSNTDVIGLSLGGAIATSFASFYPEMVKRLVLIAPAGIMQDKDMPTLLKLLMPLASQHFITSQPYIRPLFMSAVKRFAKSTRYAQSGLEKDTEEIISNMTQIAFHQFLYHPGYFKAVLRTVVDFPFTGLRERFKRVGEQKEISVLMIWGDKDTTVPFYHSEEAKRLLPNAKMMVYKDQGHDVLLTKWKSVNANIINFLTIR
ncbi:Alpha/Beta hydrolase protein [Cokeromyces recurvatus]|uniref:Alpha/Beta hydrolase protein n=1 Tax=Cokeromyces recurvatus TaxID=90255 RepID=UPI00221F5267|nr:Alpha/Beta hydrolase protein [Cokeromyces recurvatus]KAI7903769.1 Alpha/Beta hydrolase protein [Cokeromyces recurvatus]